MPATLTTCPTCTGPAATRAGVTACLAPGCWWSGEAPVVAKDTAEPIEDLAVGFRRVRVEHVNSGDYCWSVYVDDIAAEQYRGRAMSREAAWRAALGRLGPEENC